MEFNETRPYPQKEGIYVDYRSYRSVVVNLLAGKDHILAKLNEGGPQLSLLLINVMGRTFPTGSRPPCT